MRPIQPHVQPLRITATAEEVVFLGKGPAGFSMTPGAARGTLRNLAEALLSLQPAPTRGARAVVLLVEDEPMVREIGVTLLEDAGYMVIATDGAKAALCTLETGDEIHLLFTDIQMPADGGVLANWAPTPD